MVANGLFSGKLIYGITAWGTVWDLPGVLDMEKRCSPSLTLEDNRKLQVLQNRVMRLATGLPWDSHVTTLLEKSGQLSVQQLTAYHSILQVYKTKVSKQPGYLYSKLFPNAVANTTTRGQTTGNVRIENNLSLARSSFFYRASKLWNSLPPDMKQQKSLALFKSNIKSWIRANVKGVPQK